MMGVVGFLAQRQLRRHGLRVSALALLVSLIGGVVISSVLGADRSRTSLQRFIDDVAAADVGIFVGSPEELDPLVDHPDIEHLGRFSMPALFPTAILERDDVFIPFAASLDGAVPYEFNGYRIIDGRLPDPREATEIALHEATAELLEVGVGGQVEMAMFTPEELEHVFGYGDLPERYETVDMDVVAVVRDPLDVIARSSDIVVTPLTPAAADRFVGVLGSIGEGAFVELRDGTDTGAFMAEVSTLLPEAEIERWVGGTDVADTGFGSTLDVIADGLLVVASVVGGAGVLAVGQAFFRGAAANRSDGATLASLGLERRQRGFVGAAPALAVAFLGGVGAAVVAIVLSPRFPIGVARRAEPDPGVEAHPGTLLGAAAVVVVCAGLALGAAVLAGRRHLPRRVRGTRTLPAIDPVAQVVGSGNASLARSTQVAAAFGGLAVAAALVFATSMDRLLDTPQHYGWTFDAAVVSETNDATLIAEGFDVAADPAVAEAAEALLQIQTTVDGTPTLGYAIGDGTGTIRPVVARGQPPTSGDEVALGRETMRQLGVDIGDDVAIDGGTGAETFRVVGQAIIPVSADGGRVGNGAAFVTSALPRFGLSGPDACEQASCYRQIVVRWEEGADIPAAADRMLAEGSAEFVRPMPPPEVERLSEIESMPWAVSGLLALLACAAAVHAVVVTVRRRRRDLAVLRTLGATPSQTRRGVRIHIASLVAAWAVAGTLLGVVVGRLTWQAVAASVGVVAVPDVPVPVIVALPLVVLLLAQVAALLPARRASQLHPAAVLRSE